MGGKRLKKLRAEKSKVHLKRKKLPKGQNVTDTAFKVKKIVLVEQLKKVNEGEPVSNWNVPIKDLLSRLNHYNFTSRLNGLCGMKELLMNYPEILQGPSLKSLVCRLLDLLTDEEHKIRKTAVDLLSYVFDVVPVSAVLPFHDLLNVHLGCAMTHRDISVQWDSLNFIDFMLKYSPEAIRHYFGSIAPNFIRILKTFLSEPHRLPLGKFRDDVEKSKTEMFFKFYQFLVISFSEITKVKQSSGKSIDLTSSDRKGISLRESNDQYKQIPDLSSLFINSKNTNTTFNEKNYEEFQSICSLIMPLMFETWIEYCPDQRCSGKNSEFVLSEKTATLLCILLQIIMALYEKSLALEAGKMDCWVARTYKSQFKNCFIQGFPYLAIVSRKKANSEKQEEFPSPGSSSCVLQNLIICYLSYCFQLVHECKDVKALMENFISWALARKISTESDMLLKVVEAIGRTSDDKSAKQVLGKVVCAYDATDEPEVRRELSRALMKVVLDEKETNWEKEQGITKWMRSLPERLCEVPVSVEVIETVLRLVTRPEGAQVLKEVDAKALQILGHLPILKKDGMAPCEGQKMIASILYRCDNKVVQELLNQVLTKESYSQNLRDYITNTFYYKLSTQ